MSNFIVLLIYLYIQLSISAPDPEQLYFNGLSSLTGWEVEEQPSAGTSTLCPSSFSSCFQIRDADGEEAAWRATVTTIGYYNIYITIQVKSSELSTNGECRVSYAINGNPGSFTTIWSLTGEFATQFVTAFTNNDADNNSNLLWIRLTAVTRSSYCYFDNLRIYGTPITPAPTTNPTRFTESPTSNTLSPTRNTVAPTANTLPPSQNTQQPTTRTAQPTPNSLPPTLTTVSPTSGTFKPTSNTPYPTLETISPTSNTPSPTVTPTLNPTNIPTLITIIPTLYPTYSPLYNPSISPSLQPTISPSHLPTLTMIDDPESSGKSLPLTTVYIFMGSISCVCATILIYVISYYRYKNKKKPETNDAIQLSFNDGIDSRTKFSHNNSLPSPVILKAQETPRQPYPNNTNNTYANDTFPETNPDDALPEQPSPNDKIITKGITDISAELSLSEGMTHEGPPTKN